MHVVVGKYVGSDLSSKKPDLSDAEMDANRYDPHPGDGEEGQPVFLGIREERVGKRLWHINKFNIMGKGAFRKQGVMGGGGLTFW